mmetsp:Transcript_3433/g.6779  ORF Transcript_3433/g.6779 Transcript_3433/m.6779 type:complete len:416 (-) Transcript_3433:153-1400(-)
MEDETTSKLKKVTLAAVEEPIEETKSNIVSLGEVVEKRRVDEAAQQPEVRRNVESDSVDRVRASTATEVSEVNLIVDELPKQPGEIYDPYTDEIIGYTVNGPQVAAIAGGADLYTHDKETRMWHNERTALFIEQRMPRRWSAKEYEIVFIRHFVAEAESKCQSREDAQEQWRRAQRKERFGFGRIDWALYKLLLQHTNNSIGMIDFMKDCIGIVAEGVARSATGCYWVAGVVPKRDRSFTRRDLSLRNVRDMNMSTLSASQTVHNSHVYDGDYIIGYAPDFETYTALTGEGTKYRKNSQHYNYWNACRPDIMRQRMWPRDEYRIVPIKRIAEEAKNACMHRQEAANVWASKRSAYSNDQKKQWDYNLFWLLEQELGSRYKWKNVFDMERGDYGIVKGGVACDEQGCFWVYGVVPK